jgi:hypothetical protein
VNFHHRKLLGESLREIGVLVFVFVPLNMLLESKTNFVLTYPVWLSWLTLSPDHLVTLFFATAGILLLYYGIKIEAKAVEEGGNQDAVSNDRI